jgi:hypothetical protein
VSDRHVPNQLRVTSFSSQAVSNLLKKTTERFRGKRFAIFLKKHEIVRWFKNLPPTIRFRIDSTDTSPFTEIAGATSKNEIEFGISAASGIGVCFRQ